MYMPFGFFSQCRDAGISVKSVHLNQKLNMGAQWLSGTVLDMRPRGRGFEPHRHNCVVVLEQETFILA